MANQEQLEILKQGVEVWNKWREENPEIQIDLSGATLYEADLSGINLVGASLTNANLLKASLLEANLETVDFRKANLTQAMLYGAILRQADLTGANLFETYLMDADLSAANLTQAELIQANLTRTRLTGANLDRANLSGAILVQTNVDRARISGSCVYGINVWDLEGEFEEQKNLIVTRSLLAEDTPILTVDNIKIAQLFNLILNNKEIRSVINTLTSKLVLILGRFTGEGRKEILDALRERLRDYDLLPVVVDFQRPTDKDYTETVQTLAGLSLFVIVDVTNPKSTPLEMEATVKQFKIPYLPIIDLSADKAPFSMIVDLQKNFHWVLPTFGYNAKRELLDNVETAIIRRALEKHNELREQKATEQKILTIDDLKRVQQE